MSKRGLSDSVPTTIFEHENYCQADDFLHFYNNIIINGNWDHNFSPDQIQYVENMLRRIILFLQMERQDVDISSIPPHFGRYPVQNQQTLLRTTQDYFIASGKYPRFGSSSTDTSHARFMEYTESVRNASLIGLQIFNVIFNLDSHRMCLAMVTESQNLQISQNTSVCSTKIMNIFVITYINKHFKESEIAPQPTARARLLRNIRQKIMNFRLLFKSLSRRNGNPNENLFYNRLLLSYPDSFRNAFSEYVEPIIRNRNEITRLHLKYLMENVMGVHPIYELSHLDPHARQEDLDTFTQWFQMRCKRFAKFINFIDIGLEYAHLIVSRVGPRLDPLFQELPTRFPDEV